MRIIKDSALGLCVDYQERLMPAMRDGDAVISRAKLLIEGLRILNVPVIVTEQYPKGLGRTVEVLRGALGDVNYCEKNAFSCCDDENIMKAIESSGKKNVIVFGVEAHVCVLQTVEDLIERGYNAVLAADCLSSRREADMRFALERARGSGAVLTTAEAILFELQRYAAGDTFKSISKLVK
ncbi:MAG: hydrolase [Oscillospiraceae bacterium]|jgi:nicotinamidase-related amidase